jgi:hypothetical protein
MDASTPGSDKTRGVEIVVIVNIRDDPITGTVSDGDGRTTAFVGYARLVAAIERHREPGGAVAASAPGEQNATGDDRGYGHGARARTRARADSHRA